MTDPVQHDSPPITWLKKNKFEAFRRLIIGLMLVGVILYIFGEVLSHDGATQTGIWILIASMAGGITYKVLAFIAGFLGIEIFESEQQD